MWCCPPENPTQDLVEFLKHVRFCGEKQGSVSWVPAGWDAQTRAIRSTGMDSPGQAPALSHPPWGSAHQRLIQPQNPFLLKPTGYMGWDPNPEPRATQGEPHPHFQLQDVQSLDFRAPISFPQQARAAVDWQEI